MTMSKGKAVALVVSVICMSFFLGYTSMEKRQSTATNKTRNVHTHEAYMKEEQATTQNPANPEESSYEKALTKAVSSAPLLEAVVQGREFSDIGSALSTEYDLTVVPRVGGGEVYVWSYKTAPEKTWIRVEHMGDNIFQVDTQIGLATQQARFLVDLNNGAVEKQFDSFSAQMGF